MAIKYSRSKKYCLCKFCSSFYTEGLKRLSGKKNQSGQWFLIISESYNFTFALNQLEFNNKKVFPIFALFS